MIDLKGRTAIVFGVANKRSIAWGIAQKLNEAGARLLITYQNERLKLEAEDMIKELPGRRSLSVRCLPGRRDRSALLHPEREARQARHSGALGGICSRRGDAQRLS